MVLVLILMLQLTWRAASGVGIFTDMGLPQDDLYQPGDILLGGIFPLNRKKLGSLCGGGISSITIQGVQGMIYMIDQINDDPSLLPNVTLGYVILNDCSTEKVAIARSTQFVPLNNELENSSKKKDDNGTVLDSNIDAGNITKLIGRTNLAKHSPPANKQYEIVAVVGPYSSTFSTVVSPLLSFYHIPHISWIATSDQLTSEERYPYFSRVVPADRFQAIAIVDVIAHFNWTYISALYSQGSYGSNGIKDVLAGAREKGMCVAFTSELRGDFLNLDYDHVIQGLRANYRARVVVLFVEGSYGKKLLEAVDRAQAKGEFIFIGSEGFSANVIKDLGHLAINMFSFIIPGGPFMDVPWGDPGFARYYKSLNPWNNATGHKWYGQYTPEYAKCSWDASQNDSNWCGIYKNVTDFPGFKISNWPVRIMDCVKAFALALHATIHGNCPDVFRGNPLPPSCIEGEKLQENTRKVDFLGYSVKVKFNDEGDLVGSQYMLMIHQFTKDTTYKMQGIGMWNYENRTLDIDASKLVWFEMVNGTAIEVSDVPKSVCAEACKPGQFQIQGELACCWECHPCPVDHVVTEDGRSCRPCETTNWPDQVNHTVCEPIPPVFLHWTDPMTIGLLSIDLIAFVLACLIATIFILKKDKKVIKGSGRELMASILTGLFVAYITVFTSFMKPNKWTCYLSYFGFHFSSSLIFVPLFLKTFRIYQIFTAAERCKQKVRFAGTRIILGTLVAVLSIQVSIVL